MAATTPDVDVNSPAETPLAGVVQERYPGVWIRKKKKPSNNNAPSTSSSDSSPGNLGSGTGPSSPNGHCAWECHDGGTLGQGPHDKFNTAAEAPPPDRTDSNDEGSYSHPCSGDQAPTNAPSVSPSLPASSGPSRELHPSHVPQSPSGPSHSKAKRPLLSLLMPSPANLLSSSATHPKPLMSGPPEHYSSASSSSNNHALANQYGFPPGPKPSTATAGSSYGQGLERYQSYGPPHAYGHMPSYPQPPAPTWPPFARPPPHLDVASGAPQPFHHGMPVHPQGHPGPSRNPGIHPVDPQPLMSPYEYPDSPPPTYQPVFSPSGSTPLAAAGSPEAFRTSLKKAGPGSPGQRTPKSGPSAQMAALQSALGDGELSEEEKKALLLLSVVIQRNGPDDKAVVDPRKYKTRMCRNWEETGGCPYEQTCCFAHGPSELRTLAENHKLLASIGYFSNVVLLAMTNGKRPVLPPHSLYQQPAVFVPPENAEQLQECTSTVPAGTKFPFQDPLPAALRALQKEHRRTTVGAHKPRPPPVSRNQLRKE